ncbi:hypothetical protein ACEQ8H_001393 [Pleosporales sp. CAS-2024a]
MLFTSHDLIILASISVLARALPLDAPRRVEARQKNYSVVNVDGGSSDSAPTTTTVTQDVTTTVLSDGPTPTPTSWSGSSSWTSTTSAPCSTMTPASAVETPTPIYITVTASQSDGPTEYYDNGLWHTSYPIKTFAAAVASAVPSPSPGLESWTPSYNQTGSA